MVCACAAAGPQYRPRQAASHLSTRRERRNRLTGWPGPFHFDFCAQALSKILRGQDKDLGDVEAMIARGLIDPRKVWALFTAIEDRLFRFPNIGGVFPLGRPKRAGPGPGTRRRGFVSNWP
jgi:hypothetical protein